jgi:Leucine-rich repeat (LRR) protein
MLSTLSFESLTNILNYSSDATQKKLPILSQKHNNVSKNVSKKMHKIPKKDFHKKVLECTENDIVQFSDTLAYRVTFDVWKKVVLINFLNSASRKNFRLAYKLIYNGIMNYNITRLSSYIGSITTLRIIDLSHNNLTNVPRELGQLTSLQTLCLKNNNLNQYPEVISELLYLENLNLRSNKISSLPPSIGKLKYLCVLDVSWNRLTDLPQEISTLTKLKVFNFKGNSYIKHMPREILCMNLISTPTSIENHYDIEGNNYRETIGLVFPRAKPIKKMYSGPYVGIQYKRRGIRVCLAK